MAESETRYHAYELTDEELAVEGEDDFLGGYLALWRKSPKDERSVCALGDQLASSILFDAWRFSYRSVMREDLPKRATVDFATFLLPLVLEAPELAARVLRYTIDETEFKSWYSDDDPTTFIETMYRQS